MQGRVGGGPARAGACFFGVFLSISAPTSRHSFRYTGTRPPPSGQTRTTTTESASEEEDEDEEGEDEVEEDEEGSGDVSELGWDLETHGGGEGGMFGPKGSNDKRQCKICTNRISWTGSTTTPGERHFESYLTGHMHVWHHRYHTPHVQLPGETFPRGGYRGVPDGYVDEWPHATCWPNLPKKKGKAGREVQGSGRIDEKFQLRTAVLEFREMHRRHGGEEMAKVVEEMVVQWGLQGRCLGLTTDNASSNIAAFRRLSEEGAGQGFFNSRMRFR
ncbi:unnamed protein product [Closterium sp. NIES-54]